MTGPTESAPCRADAVNCRLILDELVDARQLGGPCRISHLREDTLPMVIQRVLETLTAEECGSPWPHSLYPEHGTIKYVSGQRKESLWSHAKTFNRSARL